MPLFHISPKRQMYWLMGVCWWKHRHIEVKLTLTSAKNPFLKNPKKATFKCKRVRNGTWLCRPSSSFSPRWNIPFILRISLTSVWLTAVRWRLGRTRMLLYITFKWISPVLCRQLSRVAAVGGFLSVRGSTPAVCHYLEANHKVPYLLRSKTLPEPVGGEGKHISRPESPQCCDFFFFPSKGENATESWLNCHDCILHSHLFTHISSLWKDT